MNDVRLEATERYGKIASEAPASGCCGGSSGCGSTSPELGYTKEELARLPEGADLGLGCGNPQALAKLQRGERVLDLGSGAGIDCFLAAERVGPSGFVIGVDMTPQMVARARENAARAGTENVQFRLGEIEHLPVGDASVDVILSNCVVNLSPDKPRALQEAFRVLAPGGRLAISDMVATRPLPDEVRADLDAVTSCVGGAVEIPVLESMLREAGFVDVRVATSAPGADLVVSASIEARKPA